MREILIHGLEGGLGGDMPQQLLANPHQRRRAAGREIESAHELLARRLGRQMQRLHRRLAGRALKAGDGGLHLGRIGPELLSQRGQESQARLGFGLRIALQQQARQRHAGSLAAAGEELLAQSDQIFRRRRAAGAAQQAAAALAQGLQQLVQE